MTAWLNWLNWQTAGVIAAALLFFWGVGDRKSVV